MSTNKVGSDRLYTVQVRDPNGHRSVFLEGLRGSATVAEIRARAMSELRLTQQTDWNVRQDSTGRLLREDQRLEEFADQKAQMSFTMQPDAGLG
jgi:hypothetical protein